MANKKALVFQFQDQKIRVAKVETGRSPWFVAKDVCDALGIKLTGATLRGLSPEDRGRYRITTPGGPQEMAVVNESGLYDLVFKSRKKEARAFRRWVTNEVLPSIRKTGSYSRGQLATTALQPDQLGPLVTQLTALTTQLTARKSSGRNIYICAGEIRLLKAQARGIAKREGQRGIGYLWKWIRESNDLESGKAFSTVPRIWFPAILETLKCRGREAPAASTETKPSPTERGSIATLPNNLPPIAEHRPATTADFDLEDVARKLTKDIADLGFEIPASALHRIGGIYEVTSMDLLYLPVSAPYLLPKVPRHRTPYLDTTRYAHVLHWVRANSEVVQFLIDMHRRLASNGASS